MLDQFLKVACQATSDRTYYQMLVQDLVHLPNDELKSLAEGTSKLACSVDTDDGPNGWLNKFEGTPYYQDALALEEALLDVDIRQKQSDLEEDAQREARPNFYKERDALRLKKRILDLNLTKDRLRSSAPAAEAPLVAETVPDTLPEQPPAEKAASAGGVQITPELIAAMRKEAFGSALLAAGKGIGQFGAQAGKSIVNATRAGGIKGGLNMAGTAARVGARRAGEYAVKNPGMAAGIGAGALGGAAALGAASS